MVTLISIAGIVACLLYRRQAPGPLSIAAAALAGMVAITMLESVAEPVIYRTLGPQRQGGLLVSNALGAMKLLSGIVRAAGIGGLIGAVLIERRINFRNFGW